MLDDHINTLHLKKSIPSLVNNDFCSLQLRLYSIVMEDVISGIRETFLDDGVDEQVLQELRHLWETKLLASKAVEQTPEPDHSTPPIIVHSSKANGTYYLCFAKSINIYKTLNIVTNL